MGMALMLTLIPPYIVVAAWLGQRRSLALLDELRPQLPDPAAADAAVVQIRAGLRTYWPVGVVLGFGLGLLNTQPLEALRSEVPVLDSSLSLGQLVMWSIIGLLFVVRLTAARAFRGLAGLVEINLLRPDRLRPLARSGVVDVVIIAGAMLFTPLQSIDAEFRWYNYHFGLLVSVPATIFYLVWPLWPLHRRNQTDRAARLEKVERQLGELGSAAPDSAEGSARLEALLAHRDRLRAARTWPLSTGLLSRVVLYLVIPPLAWAGAAVVERVVDALQAHWPPAPM
jgi:hypothetical protein